MNDSCHKRYDSYLNLKKNKLFFVYHNYVKVAVVFTYNYSLKTWDLNGTLEKELKPYQILNEEYGVEFIFITYGNYEDSDINLKINGSKIIPIYEILKCSKRKPINYLKSFFIPFFIKKELKEVDLIKQNQLLGSWVSIILKKILNKPLFIRTGYDMYEFSIFENKSWFIKKLYRYLTSWSIKSSDLYTVSSKCDYDFLNKEFGSSNIQIRPNWVEKNRYLEFDKRHDKKIVSIGRLEKQKNFEYLIESFKNSDFEIDLIGEGSLKREIDLCANKNNVKVNFFNKLSNSEVLSLLPNYKFFISTSNYEGNPKSVLEALSAGCIVFVSNIKNHTEIIKDRVNGFVYETDKKNLNHIFHKRLNHENLDSISKKGYEDIYETNSIKKMVSIEYLDLHKLLKRG